MKREELLARAVEMSKVWPTTPAKLTCGWSFLDGQYVHAIHDPITIDDWNRAKIKPNTKIRIESPDHSEYVQNLAFEAGFSWPEDGSLKAKYQNKPSLYMTDSYKLAFGNPNGDYERKKEKKIFIEMPKAKEEELERVKLVEPRTVEIDAGEKVMESEQENNNEWAMVGEPREGCPFFAVKFDQDEKYHIDTDVSHLINSPEEASATGAVGRMVTLNITAEEELEWVKLGEHRVVEFDKEFSAPQEQESNNEYTAVGVFPFSTVELDLTDPKNIKAKVLAEKVGSKHSHYFKDVSDLDEVDVYRVCDLFEVNDPSGAKQHAVKKILCSGQRGAKDERKDLEEARDTINRKLEMMKEDNQ